MTTNSAPVPRRSYSLCTCCRRRRVIGHTRWHVAYAMVSTTARPSSVRRSKGWPPSSTHAAGSAGRRVAVAPVAAGQAPGRVSNRSAGARSRARARRSRLPHGTVRLPSRERLWFTGMPGLFPPETNKYPLGGALSNAGGSRQRMPQRRKGPRRCGWRLSRGGAATRPQALDALQGVAFRLRDVQVNEGRGEHAHDPVYPVGETVIEQVVEDRISVEHLEGPGNEQVGDPLGGDRDGKGTVLDRVRKHLREQHPGYRSPRQRKPGAVNHHRAQRTRPNQPGLEQEAERQHRDGHNQRTADKQRLSSPAIDSQDGDARGQRACDTDEDRLPERCVRGGTHAVERQRG